MTEKSNEQVLAEEKEDQETMVNISAEYTDIELERGYSRTNKDKIRLRIYRPTVSNKHNANRFGKAQFIECLKAGVPTRTSVINAAREAGIWTEALEQRMTEINGKVDKFVEDQQATENKAKKAKIREKIRKLKTEQLEIAGTFTEITRNTIEQIQDDAEQSYLLCKTVFLLDDGGVEKGLLYPEVSDLNGERDMRFIELLNNSASAFWMGDSVADFFALGELLDEETSEPDTESPKT